MAYTPTTWSTGDTITASALNKMENGIANAVGAASIRISASGFGGSTKEFGKIVYAYRDNNAWVIQNDDNGEWKQIIGFEVPNDRLVVMPLPSDDNVGLFFIDTILDERIITGDISTTTTTLHLSSGSVVLGNAYRVTGNGSFTFIGT